MDRTPGFLHRVIQAIGPIAEQLGAPGLAIVAFFDSSFLSLPEVADALLVLAVVHEPLLWPYYAAATTAGSMAGCLALYLLARKGGEAFLRRRMRAERVERSLALFQRYGLLAIIVPSILPPPLPFKIFVLMSGVARVPIGTFLTAIAIGRGIRYGGEAWLAYRYGGVAMVYIRENLPTVLFWTAMAIAVLGTLFIVWQRRRTA